MDYLLLLLAFVSALLGIFGNTWDKNKKGIKKLNTLGGVVVTVLIFSLILSISSIYKKNKEFSNVKSLVYSKVELGIWNILSPLNFDGPVKDTAKYFSKIKDTFYLSKLYKKSLFDPFAQFGTSWTHPFRRDSIRIKMGEDLLNAAIDDYHDVLDSKTIQLISNILTDGYYNNRYKLSRQHDMILISLTKFKDTTLSISDKLHLSFSTYGSFYSESDMKGDHTYDGMLSFIQKIEVLYKYLKE